MTVVLKGKKKERKTVLWIEECVKVSKDWSNFYNEKEKEKPLTFKKISLK